jgi:hypothetical protein
MIDQYKTSRIFSPFFPRGEETRNSEHPASTSETRISTIQVDRFRGLQNNKGRDKTRKRNSGIPERNRGQNAELRKRKIR